MLKIEIVNQIIMLVDNVFCIYLQEVLDIARQLLVELGQKNWLRNWRIQSKIGTTENGPRNVSILFKDINNRAFIYVNV